MSRTTICAIAVAVISTGCATPLPVAEFQNDVEFYQAAYAHTVVGKFGTLAESALTFRAYTNLYGKEEARKRQQAQNASEFSFYSSVVAALGGIAQSREVAIAGGLGAAGGGIYNERYNLKVQATNYKNASAAMECMDTETIAVASVPVQNFQIQQRAGNTIGADVALRDIAQENFRLVRNKLRSLQSDLVLGTPDLGRLQEAARDKPDNVAPVAHLVRPANAAAQAEEDADKEKVAAYRNKMKACAASILG